MNERLLRPIWGPTRCTIPRTVLATTKNSRFSRPLVDV